jgi:hypothetical protein
MIRTKLMLLGLCAALFGVMAFGASGAQAAKWLILTSGGVAKTGEELKAAVGGEVDTTPVLHTEVLKDKYLVECTGFTTVGVNLEGEGKVTEGGKVEFTGCTGKINGVANSNCNPKSSGKPEGSVLTNEGKGQLVLREGVGETKLEPKTGTTFATLEMKEACPIGEKLPINGVLYLSDSHLETHEVKHLIVEGAGTEMWATANKTEEHKATITGSGWVFLTLEHSGLAWDGMAE